jgi:hypothetical protein
MAVFRVEKNKNYTQISNFHFRDKNLSWKAKGILSNMLSLPDEWDYSLAGLATLSSDGMTATRSAIKELEEYGYLIRRPVRKDGRICDWEYLIFENPDDAKQVLEEQDVGKQQVENHTQLNTNRLTTKQSNTKKSNTNISTEFDILWKLYPRKIGKPKALKSYEKARKNGTTFEQVKQGIELYCQQIDRQKTSVEYIKHGATWFNNECWNDEYSVSGNRSNDLDDIF